VSATSNAAEATASRWRVSTPKRRLIVVEVAKVEADATISHRGNRELAAGMRQGLQRRLEEWAAYRIEHDLCAAR
jgi:hypothetical protein